MADLPRGTVTFLFTDIEGSTRLLLERGARYAGILNEYRRVLRETLARHGGVEVDMQGDALFSAFSRAADAVACATQAQQALAAGTARVRMGLHTGEPQVTDGGYVGIDVHRAARICAAGHGGQVLLSETTYRLANAKGRDLGMHRLKDLGEPLHLYQLGDAEFPPPRSLNQTNLPAQLAPLVGRQRELTDVVQLLRSGTRLVTITGPGGIGKTRLALQAAAELVDEFSDGSFWVPLAALRDPRLTLPTIAQTIGARHELARHIGDGRMLLTLDDFEPVLAAAPALYDVLTSCPNLYLCVTSRALLRITGEREYTLPPLSPVDGVTLFRERAARSEPEAVVREICQRLDGLPLAIELAAARTRVLPPAMLLKRLERRLPLLTGGPRDAPERQRTLRATIDWSYDLLSSEEQRLLARLAVFAGSFTADAAEKVCDADLDVLQSLVEQSLVRQEGERLVMLETIREYAMERLEGSGESDQISHRHAEWALALGLPFEQDLGTPRLLSALPQLRAEIDNARAAVAWALERTEPEFVLRLIRASWAFGPSFGEVAHWYDAALPTGVAIPSPTLAHAFRDAGAVAQARSESRKAEALLLRSLSMHQALGDEDGQTRALRRLGDNALGMRDVRRGRAFLEKSLALATRRGDSRGRYLAQVGLARAEHMLGHSQRAVQMLERSLALARAEGDLFAAGAILHDLGDIALDQRALGRARKHYEEAASIASRIAHDHLLAYCLAGLAAAAALGKNAEHAGRLFGVLRALEESGGGWVATGDLARYEKLVAEGVGEAQAAFERGTAAAQDMTAEDALRLPIANETSSERKEEHHIIGSDPYASH